MGASWVNYFSRGQYLPKFQSFPPTESKTFFLPDVVCFLLFLPSILRLSWLSLAPPLSLCHWYRPVWLAEVQPEWAE